MLPAPQQAHAAASRPVFPFTAIVGQEELRLALLLCAVDPMIGGVLALGDRGTGKSTAVRALAQLLPEMPVILGDPYNSEPGPDTPPERIGRMRVPVVDLPLGASEDRVVGALDLERALTRGEKAFEPGLLARAHRGFLYIDEVNLLEDHLVDLLLDVAASGENLVEREGISLRHPARFVLVGSGNPEEGELRPQLLDRFGLAVEVRTPTDLATRIEVVKRRDAFERDPYAFLRRYRRAEERQRAALLRARAWLPRVVVPDQVLEDASRLCLALGTDGLRGELTLVRAARALAALEGQRRVGREQLRRMALPALRHRLRRNPLDDASSSSRVERAVAETLPL
ncbi:MAG: magnesium chelatase ATPase subunit I [Rhodovarius sp.]|nr:magnesium chelatase ATPase subunit I [Rhodovarius sp.]